MSETDKDVKAEQGWKWWHWMFFWQMVGAGHSSASQTQATSVQPDTTNTAPQIVDAPSADYSAPTSIDTSGSGNY